jgi:hypothetical protein
MTRTLGNATIDTDLGAAGVVLDDLGVLRASVDRGEALILQRAVDWADLHPATEPEDEACPRRPRLVLSDAGEFPPAVQDYDVPPVRWTAIPELAARLGLSTAAGQSMILEGLEIRHRLPRLWRAVQAGKVQVWRSRRIAQMTLGEHADVAGWVDEQITPVAQRVGVTTIDRLIDEAMLRLHPEERELRREEAREQRHVDIHSDGVADGLSTIDIATDTIDALDFDAAIALIASKLAELGDTDSLDVRRAKAVGILADPEAALELLATSPSEGTPTPGARPRKQIVLHVHLSEAAINGSEPVGRLANERRPVLAETIREWAGRADARVTVLPVIDLNQGAGVEQYEIPDRIKRRVELAMPTCAHPWCNRPAERCDKDHSVPYDAGGPTHTDNLAPLCRRHHRLKTLTAWTYETIAPATYLWTSPHGRRYLRDNTGTTDVTP